MLFLRVIAWCGDEKFSLKKSCFYLYIRRRYESGRNTSADSRRVGEVYDYCLLFNDDVEFYSKTIEKMLSIENESREILVGPTCDTEGKLSYGGVIKKSRFHPNFDIIDAPSLPAVYEKYKERGGRPVFHPADIEPFITLLTDIYDLASSADYIRDMRINEKLGTLLTLLMEQSWHPESVTISRKRLELAAVKEYLDEHYTEKIALDYLSEHFFINKFYLSKIFKETYGTTVNNYLISKRITRAKQLLRFTDMTVDEIGVAVGMGDANYFSRMFRKVEGSSPREYRKQW